MAIEYKELARSIPAVTTRVNLYTVPAGKQAIVSSLIVVSTADVSQTFNIYAQDTAGETTGNNTLGLNLTIPARTRVSFTEGWTLSEGQTIAVQSNSGANLNFFLFGCEIS